MANEVDIRARLTLDDKASSEINKVKNGFKGAADEAKKAEGAGQSFLKQVAAMAIGANIGGMAKGLGETAFGWLKTAAAAQDANRSMAATFAISRGISFEQASKEADSLKRSLQEMATDIGVSSNDVSAGLQVMLETMGASEKKTEQINHQMRELSLVAKVMGRPVEDVAREFGFMNEGVVRARGGFTQMLAKVGVFGEDVKKGVAEFNKLAPEERAAKLDKGLSTLATRMKDFPKTTTDIATSYENLLGMMKGTFASPIIKAITPVLEELAAQIKVAQPEIVKFTESIGKELGVMAKEAAKAIADAMRWAAGHAKDIKGALVTAKDALVTGFGMVKDAVMFVVKHKEVFMAMAAAWKVSSSLGGLGGMAKIGTSLAGAGGTAATGVGAAVQGAAGAGGLAGAGAAAVGLLALGAAIAALGLAAWQAKKLYDEVWGDMSGSALDAKAYMERANKELDEGRIAEAQASAKLAHDTNASAINAEMKLYAERIKVWNDATDTYNAAISKAGPEQITGLADAWNKAVATGNTSLQLTIAQMVASSSDIQTRMQAVGVNITGGMESMMQLIEQAAQAMRNEFISTGIMLRASAGEGAIGGDEGAKRRAAMHAAGAGREERDRAPGGGGGTTINVNKMEIKQEFRDQDPDRIAVVFQRDLLKHATRRIQSKRATIFGV